MKFRTTLTAALVLFAAPVFAATLQSVPETFDFGWAPDDARISCEFTIKNTGNDSVALQALKPACGCTAAQFTPKSLSSSEDTKIGLTFNTRGYKGIEFSKSAELTTEGDSSNVIVYLKGHSLDPDAKIHPQGNGIASFEPGMKKDSQRVSIQNKAAQDVTLSVVQAPASWATVKLDANSIKAGDAVDAVIKVSGSFNDVRETSVTFEAMEGSTPHRLTIAIRTGPAAKAYEPIRPAGSSVQPTNKPKGPSDPLKLKGVEPVKKSK
jgi:hypothetical protein